MSGVLSLIIVALPLVSAAVLASVASWRFGAWINAGSASLQFVAACALGWFAGSPEAYLVLLTSLVAMTVSWSGRRDLTTSLVARSLTRTRARLYHAGYQTLIAAIQAAALAGDLVLTWFALAIAVAAAAVVTGAARGPAATAAVDRLLTLCGAGMMLAMLGTLLLGTSPTLAGLFLLLGYGSLAGVLPLHCWVANAVAEGVPPGAIIVTTLLPNVPMLLFMRLGIAPALLITVGLASLLLGAVSLFAPLDPRRSVAVAGMAQLGVVVFAIGVGTKSVAWLYLILIALARSAVLQSHGTDVMAWLTLGLLPLYALYLLASPTVAAAPWLIAPLAVGVLLTVCALLQRRTVGAAVANSKIAAIPVWLQLALVLLLASVAPERVALG